MLLTSENTAGTCKLKLAELGRSQNPCSLKESEFCWCIGKQTKKAWIIQELFMDWLNLQCVPQAFAHCQPVGLAANCKIFFCFGAAAPLNSIVEITEC